MVTVLTCSSTGGNPDSYTYKWYKDDVEQTGETGITLTLTPIDADNGKIYACEANNGMVGYGFLVLQVGGIYRVYESYSATTPISYFTDGSPSLVINGYEGPYNVGDLVVLTCQVIAASTSPTFAWIDSNGNVASTSTTIYFFATTGDNGQILTCSATLAGATLTGTQTINVNCKNVKRS